MNGLGFGRYVLGIAAAVFIVACAGTAHDNVSPSIGSAVAMSRGAPFTSTYRVLHRFGRAGTGGWRGGASNPSSGLIDVAGTLYGTTLYGGKGNYGTVYSLSAAGLKKVIYSFGANGGYPLGGLLNVNGTLYGTTSIGGTCEQGTVYSISPSGAEAVVHSFCPGGGLGPSAAPIDVGGTLYGTTDPGFCRRSSGCGTVYSLSPSGAFKVLHTFKLSPDGGEPRAPLLNVNGTLYGTTARGGSGCNGRGCGTVYSISVTGKETVLYNFRGSAGSDGATPLSGLIAFDGMLYGTTFEGGGDYKCASRYYKDEGCGTVYSISTAGKEKLLYTFSKNSMGEPYGASPIAGLVEMNGLLYGVTTQGGSARHGVLFSLSLSGTETVLHNFGGPPDGAEPASNLVNVHGTLYGTTPHGGYAQGCNAGTCGTVFELTP